MQRAYPYLFIVQFKLRSNGFLLVGGNNNRPGMMNGEIARNDGQTWKILASNFLKK